ncbi:MAG: biotin synthase [Burkholderiales bacterium]|nr:MAG: biotin synthase [Burkholderiales bacterium]
MHEEVASRMLERLDFFRELPDRWLHWEPLHGGLQAHQRLTERLPGASGLVWARNTDAVLSRLGGPGPRSWIPWRRRDRPGVAVARDDDRVGLLWANMLLHREPRPLELLRRWAAHVRSGGFLMFSCLGPDSLQELRDLYRLRGWGEPAHRFVDMHDWGDLLVQAGFAEPVVDMEKIVLTYSSAQALLDELRLLGRNFSRDRFGGLRGRGWRRQLIEGIEEVLPRTPQGRLQLSFEVIYGHAFKGEPRLKAAPQQSVPVEVMRDLLRAGRRTAG